MDKALQQEKNTSDREASLRKVLDNSVLLEKARFDRDTSELNERLEAKNLEISSLTGALKGSDEKLARALKDAALSKSEAEVCCAAILDIALISPC